MSILIPSQVTLREACAFNKKCTFDFPEEFIQAFPNLASPRDSLDFANETIKAQQRFKIEPIDGKFGSITFKVLLQYLSPIHSDYILYDNQRVQLPKREEYSLITFDEPLGRDLHKYGHFNKRSVPISGLTLHWGGIDALNCYQIFCDPVREVSSHFTIGIEKDKVAIYQMLDVKHRAWHAGSVNSFTIGIDICQQPTIDWLNKYTAKGYKVSIQSNTTGRGNSQYLTLDPRLQIATKTFVFDLLKALGLEYKAPATHDVYALADLKQYSVIGHHHVTETKWDIAPWWDSIFN